MPTVSYDGQSFQLDGRRIWLVSGTLQPARLPRSEWRDRILAARQAGLNCICVDVFWNAHQPTPTAFDFSGQNDLQTFVKLIGEQDMFCILRPGPYIGDGADLGGIPPWVLGKNDVRVREQNGAFLEATSRYFSAVMDQVRDLQITTPVPMSDPPSWSVAGGGPIVLVQAENHWTCHNPAQATAYLGELVRYLRETGCTVPITVNNNLWQRVPGAIDTWSVGEHISDDLRQFRVIQPNAPRLVSEYATARQPFWQQSLAEKLTPGDVTAELIEILACGAQYNVHPLAGGTNFGFTSGGSSALAGAMSTTSADGGAPIAEGGARRESFDAIKCVSMFAGSFGSVLAQLEPTLHHTALAPGNDDSADLSVIHQHGSQGDAIFLIRGRKNKTKSTQLLLPNGLVLPIHLDGERAAWFLLDANLGGVAELSYSNLRPLALIQKKMLVMFGPAGTSGVVAIDHAPLQITVPKDRQPVVERFEDLVVVVLNSEQARASLIDGDRLRVGVSQITDDGPAIAKSGWTRHYAVQLDGSIETNRSRSSRTPAAPSLKNWQAANVRDLLAGESASFKELEGPRAMETTDSPSGYGWYRITVPGGSTRKKTMFGEAGGRLHMYHRGKMLGIFGAGADAAQQPASLSLGGTVVVLADDAGRASEGWGMNQRKGISEHLYGVKPLKLGKPAAIDEVRGPDFAKFTQFVPWERLSEPTVTQRIGWDIRVSGKMPMLLDLSDMPVGGMVMVDDLAVGLFHPDLKAGDNHLLLKVGEQLESRRKQRLSLVLLTEMKDAASASKYVKLYQAVSNVTEKAGWAFAPWQPPANEAFAQWGSARIHSGEEPAWLRCTFASPPAGCTLWLEPNGLTKGQILLNGRNVGRYFASTSAGKAVAPQKRYYLAASWLNSDSPNELVLFDEHGADPRKVKLVCNADDAF